MVTLKTLSRTGCEQTVFPELSRWIMDERADFTLNGRAASNHMAVATLWLKRKEIKYR